MSGPCTDCGGPDYQTLLARIAEMEAIDGELRAAAKNPSHIELQDLKWALKQAEATIDARESTLRTYEEHGQPTWADIDRVNVQAEQAQAALAERDAELHEVLRVIYEEGWPGIENEHPWPRDDPEHLEAPEYERSMTPDEFLADLRARAEEGGGL